MVSLMVRILRVLCYRARTRLSRRTHCAHRPGSGSPANAIVGFRSVSTQPSRVRCAGRWPPLTAARTHSRSHAGTRSRHRRQKGLRNRRSDVQGRRERVFFTSRPPRLRPAASPPPRRAGGPLGPQGAVEVSGPTGRVTQPPRGHHPHNGFFAVNSGPLHLETLGSPNPQQLLVPVALAIVACPIPALIRVIRHLD
jgi:hypothetical protein